MNCGAVEEIEEDLLEDVEKKVERDYHFQIMDHRLTFHGICRVCTEKGFRADELNKRINE